MQIGKYLALTDRLRSPYREAFDQVEAYGVNHLIDEKIMAEKMMDLIDLLLEAQEKGTSVEEIVGEDMKSFCKNFFSDLSGLYLLKSIARQVKSWAWCVFLFELVWLIFSFGEEGFDLLHYQSDVSGYLFGILIALFSFSIGSVVSTVFASFGFTSKWIRIGTCIGCCLVGLVLIFTCLEKEINLPGFPLLLGSFLYLAIYYGIALWERFCRTGSFKRERNAYVTTFSGMVKEELLETDYASDKTVVKIFAKRYSRKNARRIKKGKPALSTEEFFTTEKKQSHLAPKVGISIGFGIVLFSGLVDSFVRGERMFESIWDFLIYLAIMAVIFFFFLRGFAKLERVADCEAESILAACKKNGVELDVFYENLISEKADE